MKLLFTKYFDLTSIVEKALSKIMEIQYSLTCFEPGQCLLFLRAWTLIRLNLSQLTFLDH